MKQHSLQEKHASFVMCLFKLHQNFRMFVYVTFTGGRRQVMAICKDPAGQSSAPMSTSRRNNVMDHNTQPGDILWTPRPWNQRDQEPRTKVGYDKICEHLPRNYFDHPKYVICCRI